MNYKEFAGKVKEINADSEQWLHILPAIIPEHRQRYIDLLLKGFDMPAAYDLVLVSKDLSDEAFREKLGRLR